MRFSARIFGFAAALLLAGCLNNDVSRAAVGAVAGGFIADATGNSVLAGAAIGGVAGALCDDVNVCN